MPTHRLGYCLLPAALVVIAPIAGGASRAWAQCNPTFAPASFQPIGGPYQIVVGDFNHDGLKDLASANFSSSSMTVRLANANNPGTYFGSITIPLGLNPRGAAVADFNHDGVDDLAVVYNGGGPANTRLAIILSNGNGTFQTPLLQPIASQPLDLEVADFNHDGNPDVANICGCGSVSVMLGNANGTFQPFSPYASGSANYRLTIADLNGDGALDLAIPTYPGTGAGRIDVALGTSPTSGAFGPVTGYATGWFGTTGTARGDFNGDGRDDLVATHSISGRVQVFLSTPSGDLVGQNAAFSGSQPQDVATGDFNGDGYLDAAVAEWGSAQVGVHLGDGQGNLTNGTYFAVTANPNSIVIADMNNDGKPDIVTGDQTGGNASILINSSPTFAFTQQPLSKRVCPGGTSGASFTATATTSVAGGVTAYRWERLVGGVWTQLANGPLAGVGDVSTAATQSLTIANVQGLAGDLVATLRCVATNGCGTLPSLPIALSLIAPCGGADVGATGGVFTGCGDGVLDNNDFVVFIDLFFNGSVIADVGSQGGVPGADGQFNNNDFVVFIDMFFSGCTI